MIGNKIANKITRISKKLQKNNSETVTNEHDKDMPNERYIVQKKGTTLLMISD